MADYQAPFIGLDPVLYPPDLVNCRANTCGGRTPRESSCPVYDCDYGINSTRDVEPKPKWNSTQRYKRRIELFRAKQEQQWAAMDKYFRNAAKGGQPLPFQPEYAGLEGWKTHEQRNAEAKTSKNKITESENKEKPEKPNEKTTKEQSEKRIVTPTEPKCEIKVERPAKICAPKQKHFPKFCLFPNVQLPRAAQREEEEKKYKAEEQRLLKEEQARNDPKHMRTQISDDCHDAPWQTNVLRKQELHMQSVYEDHLRQTQQAKRAPDVLPVQQEKDSAGKDDGQDCLPARRPNTRVRVWEDRLFPNTMPFNRMDGEKKFLTHRYRDDKEQHAADEGTSVRMSRHCCEPVWEENHLPRTANMLKTDSQAYFLTRRCIGDGHGYHCNMKSPRDAPKVEIGHHGSILHWYDSYSKRLRPQRRHLSQPDAL